MGGHFHLTLGRETLLNKDVVDIAVRFSKEKYASGDEDGPGRPTGNGEDSKLFTQERCIVICKPASVPTPVNS